MFWFAPNSLPKSLDYRPRVHDSEALAIAHRSGERIWRVLDVSRKHRETFFTVPELAGFGLIQRERRFESYQDVTAAYQKRTSAWIEPIGEWGPGQVHLRELPTDSEYDDNIVASWVPAAKPRTLQPIRVAYRVLWCASEPAAEGLARVTATFRGHPPRNQKDELLVVDFEGAAGKSAGTGSQSRARRGSSPFAPRRTAQWRRLAGPFGRASQARSSSRNGAFPCPQARRQTHQRTWTYLWTPAQDQK